MSTRALVSASADAGAVTNDDHQKPRPSVISSRARAAVSGRMDFFERRGMGWRRGCTRFERVWVNAQAARMPVIALNPFGARCGAGRGGCS